MTDPELATADSEPRYRGHTIQELEMMFSFALEHGYRDEDFEPFLSGAQYAVDKVVDEQQRYTKYLFGFREMGE